MRHSPHEVSFLSDIQPRWRDRMTLFVPFDEGCGDNSRNITNCTGRATLTNAVWSPDGLTFNGSSAYCTVASHECLNFGTGNFTIACQFMIYGSTGTHQVFLARNTYNGASGSEYYWSFYAVNGTTLSFSIDGKYTVLNSGTVVNYQWHSAAIVRDGDAGYLYFDGALVDSDATYFSGYSLSPPVDMFIGKRVDGKYLNGAMRWAAIWRKAMPPAMLCELSGRGTDALFQRSTTQWISDLLGTTYYGSAILTGLGQLDPNGIRVALGSALLDGAATLTASGIRVALGQATIDASGSLDVAGIRVALAAAALDASGSIDVDGIRVALGQALLNGQADITPNGSIIVSASAIFNASADLQAAGRKVSITFTGDTINFLFPRDVADFTFDRDTVRFNTP